MEELLKMLRTLKAEHYDTCRELQDSVGGNFTAADASRLITMEIGRRSLADELLRKFDPHYDDAGNSDVTEDDIGSEG